MELIEATRALEANVNMIRNQDQALASLVGRALRV
jgi:flagellar basal body rod protein FlgG